MDINKDIKKENSFKVPENYFEYLPQEITERIKSGSQSGTVFTLRPSIAFSSLALLSLLAFFLIYISQKSPVTTDYSFSDNDIQQIIDNPQLYNIDDNSIDDEYLSSSSEASIINENISDDEIKTFLEDNNNASAIINEL